MERWAGKVAVVIDVNTEIGAAIARSLVRQGMIVAGFMRRTLRLKNIKKIADSIKGTSKKALEGSFPRGELYLLECDIHEMKDVTKAFNWVMTNLGPVSVFVNSAAITKESSLINGFLEEWQSISDMNLQGLCLCFYEAVREIRMTAKDTVLIHVNNLDSERTPVPPVKKVCIPPPRHVATQDGLFFSRISITTINLNLDVPKSIPPNKFSEVAMPTLNPHDIAAAVIYALSSPPRVLIQDITLRFTYS